MRHQPEATGGAGITSAPVTRRTFVLAGAASIAAMLVAACNEQHQQAATPANTAGGVPASTATPVPPPSPAVRQFMALSAVLTGVPLDALDTSAAGGFLAALQTPPPGGMPVEQLAQAAAIPAGGSGATPSFADLTSKGVLSPPPAKITAIAIAANWYSGQVAAGGAGKAATVITYNDALGWKALDFAMAPALCGGVFGFWNAKPAV